MAEIRLSKIARQFNIGVGTLIDFLNGKGASITTSDPNAKISDEYMPAVEAKFGGDLAAKQDSEKVATKLKEMIDVAKKKPAQEEEELDREVIIKTNVIASAPVRPAEKPVEKHVETPVEKPVEVAAAPQVQTPSVAAAPDVEEKPAAPSGEQKIEAEKVEEKPVETVSAKAPAEETAAPSSEKAAEPAKPQFGPKIIDKIDLDSIGRKKPAAPAPAPETAPEAPKAVETPSSPKEETPAQEPKKEVREAVIKVERLAGPKVMGKVDQIGRASWRERV